MPTDFEAWNHKTLANLARDLMAENKTLRERIEVLESDCRALADMYRKLEKEKTKWREL